MGRGRRKKVDRKGGIEREKDGKGEKKVDRKGDIEREEDGKGEEKESR